MGRLRQIEAGEGGAEPGLRRVPFTCVALLSSSFFDMSALGGAWFTAARPAAWSAELRNGPCGALSAGWVAFQPAKSGQLFLTQTPRVAAHRTCRHVMPDTRLRASRTRRFHVLPCHSWRQRGSCSATDTVSESSMALCCPSGHVPPLCEALRASSGGGVWKQPQEKG